MSYGTRKAETISNWIIEFTGNIQRKMRGEMNSDFCRFGLTVQLLLLADKSLSFSIFFIMTLKLCNVFKKKKKKLRIVQTDNIAKQGFFMGI